MKVKREKAIELLSSLGFTGASKMTDGELTKKLNKLSKKVTDETTTEDDALDTLLDDVLENEGSVKVVNKTKKEKSSGGSGGKGKKASKKKTTKKATKKATKKSTEKKSTTEKKTPAKRAKVGVIATILSIIEKKPTTKEKIVEQLAKKFPDRDPESMAKTVGVQLPTRLAKDRGVKIVKDDKGRYSVK